MEDKGQSHLGMGSLEPNPLQITSIKLNGDNYLQWAQSVKVFLGAREKLSYILDDPPSSTEDTYKTWTKENYQVIAWLLNSIDSSVSHSVMFLSSAKGIWDSLHDIYSKSKKISRVIQLI